jgi:hypothetical protein
VWEDRLAQECAAGCKQRVAGCAVCLSAPSAAGMIPPPTSAESSSNTTHDKQPHPPPQGEPRWLIRLSVHPRILALLLMVGATRSHPGQTGRSGVRLEGCRPEAALCCPAFIGWGGIAEADISFRQGCRFDRIPNFLCDL